MTWNIIKHPLKLKDLETRMPNTCWIRPWKKRWHWFYHELFKVFQEFSKNGIINRSTNEEHNNHNHYFHHSTSSSMLWFPPLSFSCSLVSIAKPSTLHSPNSTFEFSPFSFPNHVESLLWNRLLKWRKSSPLLRGRCQLSLMATCCHSTFVSSILNSLLLAPSKNEHYVSCPSSLFSIIQNAHNRCRWQWYSLCLYATKIYILGFIVVLRAIMV